MSVVAKLQGGGGRAPWRARWLTRALFVAATVLSLLFASRLELSKDLTALFPRTLEAEALARVTRAFGGGDVALVLIRGDDTSLVEQAAHAAVQELRGASTISAVVDSAPSPRTGDPTEAWRFAGPIARERLAYAVSEGGMRERLRETRALLLAPGASDLSEMLSRDPLRLAMIPWQDRIEIASGVRGGAGGAFVSSDARARLLVIEPRGRAFAPDEAARFTDEAEAALARVRARIAGVTLELTGGHVIARQTEAMMRADLQRSGLLSVVLASAVFAITFRRVRALVAILPPLAVGTLWTTALAALLFPMLSAVATAFAAVVVGVGVDTGVHVYGRLLRARRDGLSPSVSALVARRETWRPTLGAALAAGGAFGCLALSGIEGMRQLGVLCALGEVLTAIAILVMVPELGALLERGTPPVAARSPWVVLVTATRARAAIVLGVVAAVLTMSAAMGVPRLDHGVVALDGRTLPALATYEAIYATFGGARGQLMVVSADSDGARARARADAVAEVADRMLAEKIIVGFDALARVAPSSDVQRARLAERDALDFPALRDRLARALDDEGFAVESFEPALEAFANPSTRSDDVLSSGEAALAWLGRRYLATEGTETLAVTYVRAAPESVETVRTMLRAADASSVVTGFAELERDLTRTLRHDLPRVLLGALAVVVVVLGAALRRPSRVLLAVVVLVVEIALVLVASRALAVRWHAYDALVLPVLLGITLDEVLFLLEAIERTGSLEQALTSQASLSTATALTTAAGFGALVICRFEGLADVGKVGALGSSAGLVVSLVVVPAVFRLRGRVRASTA